MKRANLNNLSTGQLRLRNYQEKPKIKARSLTRSQLDDQVAEFLSRGGKIQKVATRSSAIVATPARGDNF